MKYLLLILLILCLYGCDQAKDIIVSSSTPIRGIYHGNLTATYPDPDCGAIMVEDSIRFVLTDARFFYYWHNGNTFDTIAAGYGTYVIESNVMFYNEIEPTNNPPLTIDGVFNLRFVLQETKPDTMILTQGGTPDLESFFETIYLIELVKSDEILE